MGDPIVIRLPAEEVIKGGGNKTYADAVELAQTEARSRNVSLTSAGNGMFAYEAETTGGVHDPQEYVLTFPVTDNARP